jgi:hypothetical protein|tara:strand:+ start:383 stop:3382 length:3000 start_codon:yes stop_codon:yes gene_type:complete
MSLLKHISNFLIEKVLPIKFKVWLLDRLACDIANQGEDGDTELAHINSYEAKLLRSVGGSGTINKTTGLRQYGGGGSKGGGGGGGTTTQTVTKEEFPPEIRPYITDILEKAQAQEEARQAVGYPVFPGPRIAAFTPEEEAAQAGIVSLVGATQPSFNIAKGLTAASALEDTAPAIQARMSPYMQNVVDIQKREAERGAEARRQQLAAQGVAAGGYGGTREALMQSELERNLQQQLGDIQATGQQAAFQQAQQSLANLRQRQMGAGQQMAGLGTAQQASAMKELGALSGIGEQQRQQQQKALDLAFQQFREEQTYPEASLQQYQSIIRGFPISPTTTQTQQSILPQPSLSQQLIGGASALAGLGIAGQIPKLFAEGGSTFPDLSGDGKVTQKDILMGKGVIKKKEGKSISKGENVYLKKLMELIADKGKELTGMGDVKTSYDGGIVKMQSGQQPMNYMGGDVGGLSSFSLNPDPRDSLELRQKRDRAKYDPVRKVYYDPITNEVIPEIEMSREQPMKFSLGVPRSVPALKEGEVTRIRDEGSGINFKLPEFSQMPIVKGIASLGESGLETIGKGGQAFIKQASDILSPIGGIIKGGFTPRGEEELRLSQEELGQTLRTKGEELGEFGRRIVDTGKRAIDSIEDTLAKQQPGSFLQAQGLEEKLKRTKDEVSMLNNRISEAKSPTAKDELIKMRDNKIQEANSLATRYDSNVDSYEDLITKFELDRIKEKPISTPVTEKGKEEVVETKDETKTKPKERTDEEKYPFSGNTEKGVNQYIASEVADPKAAQSLSADMKKDPDSIKALSISDKYIDFMQKQKEESKSEFEKRKGFAIAQMGFAIMGGQRIVDAAAALMPNLSKIEQDRLERKNKQMLMQMEVDKLQLQEDKLKATERMAEKELGVKSQYYDTLRRAMEQKGEIKPEVIGALIPSEITSGGESYKFDDSDKQAIFARALDLYKNNKGAGISYAIGKASDEFVQSTGKKPDVSFVDRIMSLFPGLD